MRLIVVGGGAAGAAAAIRVRELSPFLDVAVIEAGKAPLRKILASGNGRCNLGNTGELEGIYHNEAFALPILRDFPINEELAFFRRLGVMTKAIGPLVYPYSESALSVKEALLERLRELGVDIRLEEKALGYRREDDQFVLRTSKGECRGDFLLFASGGASAPRLGGDGSLFEKFKQHGYHIASLRPALVPIRTFERTSSMAGLRAKCGVRLFSHGKLIHEEKGEVLFKKDGLSGIVIFNMSRKIVHLEDTREVTLKLDLVPEIPEADLRRAYERFLRQGGDALAFLKSWFHPRIAAYLSQREGDPVSAIKDLSFTFKETYGPEDAEISAGGISISDVFDSLESRLEKNVFFAGEMLDVDAPAGGWNLMWAFASGERAARSIAGKVSALK